MAIENEEEYVNPHNQLMMTPDDVRALCDGSCLSKLMEAIKLQWRDGETVRVSIPDFSIARVDVSYVVGKLKEFWWNADVEVREGETVFTITAR